MMMNLYLGFLLGSNHSEEFDENRFLKVHPEEMLGNDYGDEFHHDNHNHQQHEPSLLLNNEEGIISTNQPPIIDAVFTYVNGRYVYV
jgi:hypothetical protein